MSWRMRGLCVLSGCMLWGGCVERDAGAWHEEARALVGDRALRTLSPQTLADAQYAQEQALARDSTLVEAMLGLAALYEAQGAYEKATVLLSLIHI